MTITNVGDISEFLGVQLPEKEVLGGYVVENWHGIDVRVIVYTKGTGWSSSLPSAAYMEYCENNGIGGEIVWSPYRFAPREVLVNEKYGGTTHVSLSLRNELPEQVSNIILKRDDFKKEARRLFKSKRSNGGFVVITDTALRNSRAAGWKELRKLF